MGRIYFRGIGWSTEGFTVGSHQLCIGLADGMALSVVRGLKFSRSAVNDRTALGKGPQTNMIGRKA